MGLPIGQAGENLVNISVTQIDKGCTIGSGGLAAVMGAKKLKAIVAVQGTKGITVADPRRLQKLVEEILSRVKTYHLRDEMMQGGAMAMTAGWVPEGVLAKNSSVLIPYPPSTKEIQAEMYELHKRSRKKIACITCPMSDKEYSLTDYFGTTTLTREDVDTFLDDYYDEKGWDKATSLPTAKLKELGLDSLAPNTEQ